MTGSTRPPALQLGLSHSCSGSTVPPVLYRFIGVTSVLQVLLGDQCSAVSTEPPVFSTFYWPVGIRQVPSPLRTLDSLLKPCASSLIILSICRLCVTLTELKGQRKPRREAETASSQILRKRLKKQIEIKKSERL